MNTLRILTMLALLILPVRAQEHHAGHPAADLPIHEKFYSTWFMPDQPSKSCCNQADCYPTEAKFQDGQWFAMRREDGKFIPTPWKKVEHNRDNPDGRNHVCMPPRHGDLLPARYDLLLLGRWRDMRSSNSCLPRSCARA